MTDRTADTADGDPGDTTPGEATAGDRAAPAGVLPRGAALGRYVVLELLGAGGMGVVHTAYDPELDRKVALKLLRTDHAVGRARLLREAQALARLAHPNVVAVHDVGATEQHVFIAMEFIHGVTLTRHLATHTLAWPAVLELFVAVGRGLAAAHGAGLVHRDLKPDNVMVASDGRVRVLDFGLARAGLGEADAVDEVAAASPRALDLTLTRPGKLLGTPQFMAPEQWLAVAVDARTDQFALCVMLWRALFGEPPFAGDTVPALMHNVIAGRLTAPSRPGRAPAWLRRVLERGLAREPAARFPTVDALLAALTGGRARGRRRRLLGGLVAVVGLVGAGLGWQSYARARTRAGCEAVGAGVRFLWDDEARASLRASLVGTGLDHAATSFDRLVPWVDRWTAEWAQARTAVCVAAEVDGDLDPALYARARACLEERGDALPALLAALQQADAAAVAQAVPAAASLPTLAPCSDVSALARMPAPPDDPQSRVGELRRGLMRARGLAAAGHPVEGLAAARDALATVDPGVLPALAAEARLLVGDLEQRTGALAQAEASLTEAYAASLELGADELAASAAIAVARTVGHGSPRHAEGLLWARVAAPLVRRLGADDGLLGADLRDAQALVEQARGAYAEAMALHEQVLVIRRRELGPDHPAVARTLVNLAILHGLLGAHDREAALFEQALALQERALGPDHPEVARTLHNLAIGLTMRGELERALAQQRRALALWQRALPPEHPDVVAATMNLARIHQERGELDQALALGEQALALSERALGPEHPEFAMALNNVATMYWEREAYDKVQALLARSLAIQEKALGPEHPDLVLPLVNLASVHQLRGALTEARGLFTRALAIQEKALGPDHPDLAHPLLGLAGLAMAERRAAQAVPLLERAVTLRERPDLPPGLLGEARSRLARALWDRAGAGDRARARELAAAALTDLRAAGESMAADTAELEAWLGGR